MNMVSPLVHPPANAATGAMRFPNGFVVRVPTKVEVVKSETPRPGMETEARTGKSHSQRQQRHLISSRNFEDILEACRPRNRGDTLSAFPAALALLVSNNISVEEESAQIKSKGTDDAVPSADGGQRAPPSTQVDAYKTSDLEPVSEWGAIDFETAASESLGKIAEGSTSVSPAGVAIMEEYAHAQRDKSKAGSDKSSSPSSSFSSHHSSMLFGRSLERSPNLLSSSFPLRGDFGFGQGATALQIQPSSDLPLPLLADSGTPDDHHQHLIRHNSVLSDDSFSTIASDDRRKSALQVEKSAEALRKMMSSYDTNIFAPPPTRSNKKSRLCGGNNQARSS